MQVQEVSSEKLVSLALLEAAKICPHSAGKSVIRRPGLVEKLMPKWTG